MGFDYRTQRRADRDRLAELSPLGRAARASLRADRRGSSTRRGARTCEVAAGIRLAITPSPPSGAERVGVRRGIPERLPIPTSPSHAFGAGPSLSPLKGGEGFLTCVLFR